MVIGFRQPALFGLGPAWLLLVACQANDQLAIATHLGFDAQPVAAVASRQLIGTVRVLLLTPDERTATTSSAHVQLSLIGHDGAHLLGETASDAAAGVATFSDISVDSAGSSYRL